MKLWRTPREMVSDVVPAAISRWCRRAVEHTTFPPDMSDDDVALFRSVEPFTMTSPERVIALRDAVTYVCDSRLPGAFVECGVWRGGSMMTVAKTLLARGEQRSLYLFDTFKGMPPPTEQDRSFVGVPARDEFDRTAHDDGKGSTWCEADQEDVRRNVASTGYDMTVVKLVPGKVEDTLPQNAPEQIALLRLDTDWYESTRHELECLYDRVIKGGVIIIDDYGYWQGARKAVDEYLGKLSVRPLLNRVDSTGRLLIKP